MPRNRLLYRASPYKMPLAVPTLCVGLSDTANRHNRMVVHARTTFAPGSLGVYLEFVHYLLDIHVTASRCHAALYKEQPVFYHFLRRLGLVSKQSYRVPI